MVRVIRRRSIEQSRTPAQPGNTYRIREVHTPLDYAVTILGGTLLTITRKSMLVESCAEPITAYSAEDLEKKRTDEMRQVLDAVLKQGGDKGLPAFLMKDGSVKRGRIVEMSEESITILAAAEPARPQEKSETEKSEKKEKTGQIRVAKVLLTDGRTLTGEITSQTPRSITLRSRTGSITIEKAQIRRISYANEDVPAPAKEERVSLSRANIVRIVIAEETK